MFEYDYIGAIENNVPDDEVAKLLSSKTGYRYEDAKAEGVQPKQMIDAMFKAGHVMMYEPKPEYWQNLNEIEKKSMLSAKARHNASHSDSPVSFQDFPDRDGFWGKIQEFGAGLMVGAKDVLPETAARAAIELTGKYKHGDTGFLADIVKENKEEQALTLPSVQQVTGDKLAKGIYEGAQSVPVSLATAVPALAAGPFGGAVATIGGLAATTAATWAAFYNSEKHRFIEDIFSEYERNYGAISPEQEEQIYNAVEGAAANAGKWEAGTETAGTLFSLALFSTPVGKAVGNLMAKGGVSSSALTEGVKAAAQKTLGVTGAKVAKNVGKFGIDYAEEVTGETATAMGQSRERIDARSALNLPQTETPLGTKEAFSQVAIPTLVGTGAQVGAFGAVNLLGKKKPVEPPDNRGFDGSVLDPETGERFDPETGRKIIDLGDGGFMGPQQPESLFPRHLPDEGALMLNDIERQKRGETVATRPINIMEREVRDRRQQGWNRQEQLEQEALNSPGTHIFEGQEKLDRDVEEFRRLTKQLEEMDYIRKAYQSGEISDQDASFRRYVQIRLEQERLGKLFEEEHRRRQIEEDQTGTALDIQRRRELQPTEETISNFENRPDVSLGSALNLNLPTPSIQEETIPSNVQTEDPRLVTSKEDPEPPFKDLRDRLGGPVVQEKSPIVEPSGFIGSNKVDGPSAEDAEIAPSTAENEPASGKSTAEPVVNGALVLETGGSRLNSLTEEAASQITNAADRGHMAQVIGGITKREGLTQEEARELYSATADKVVADKKADFENKDPKQKISDTAGALSSEIKKVLSGEVFGERAVINQNTGKPTGEVEKIEFNDVEDAVAEIEHLEALNEFGKLTYDRIGRNKLFATVGQAELTGARDAIEDGTIGDVLKQLKENIKGIGDAGKTNVEKGTGPFPKQKNVEKDIEKEDSFAANPKKQGETGTSYLPDGSPIDFVYEIVPRKELVSSNNLDGTINEAYPKERQPRDRTRKAYQQATAKIANRFIPEKAGENTSLAHGAMVIAPDSMVIESGNGRKNVFDTIYEAKPETAAEYNGWLQENLEKFGIDREAYNSEEEPVLVRRRLTETDDVVRLTQEMNKDELAGMSPSEQAKVDADNLSAADLSLFRPDKNGNLNSASNRGFIKTFLGKLSPNEQTRLVTKDGRANSQLLTRVQSAIFQKAYEADSLLDLIAEEADPDMKNVLNALVSAAGSFAKARGTQADLDNNSIVDNIVEGVDFLRTARLEYPEIKESTGKTKIENQVNQARKQGNIFGYQMPDISLDIAETIAKNIRSGKRIGEFISLMGGSLQQHLVGLKQEVLFGDKPSVSAKSLVNKAHDYLEEKYEDKQQELFGDLGQGKESERGTGDKNIQRSDRSSEQEAHSGGTTLENAEAVDEKRGVKFSEINEESKEDTSINEAKSTVENVTSEISSSIITKKAEALLSSGRISVSATQKDLAEILNKDRVVLKEDFDGKIQGVYDPETEIVHLVAEHINPGEVEGLLRHEMAVHAELSGLLGEKGHAAVLSETKKLIEAGDKAVMAARRMVPESTDPDSILEETVAYFAQNTRNKDHSLYKRIVNAIKAWAVGVGLKRKLSTEDIHDIIDAAMRRGVNNNSFTVEDGNSFDAPMNDQRDGEARTNPQYSITSVNPWPENFPNVTVHTTVNRVAPNQKTGKGGHQDHKAAKAGDHKAGARLVAETINKDKIKALKKQYPDAIVVPVWALEATGVNAIPGSLASAFKVVAGFKVDHHIHQENKTSHTKKNAAQRITARAQFNGKVEKGKQYIIVDDIVTTGETVSELRHYIENNGGTVVTVSSLGTAKGSATLALKPKTLDKLRTKFNEKELKQSLRDFNIVGELEALTESEARYILKFGSVDSFRNKIIAEGEAQKRQDLNGVFKETAYKIAYHGGHTWQPEPGFPHGRPRLDLIFDKETVGEGAWAYGAGWYSAEFNKTAKHYFDLLKDQPKKISYNGYELKKDFSGKFRVPTEIERTAENIPDLIALSVYLDNGMNISRAKKALRIRIKEGKDDRYFRLKEHKVALTRINKVLSDIKKDEVSPSLYKLDIPDEVMPKLLDWDKSLSEQSEYVQKRIKDADIVGDDATGADVYHVLKNNLRFERKKNPDIAASKYLASIGIPGNTHGGHSRGATGAKYVLWDQKVLDQIALLERNQEKLQQLQAMAKGSIQPTSSNPADTINLKTIHKYFKSKGQTAGINTSGNVCVRLDNGMGIEIELVNRFSDREYEVAINSGAMDKTGQIAGNIVGNRIKLASDFAHGATLDHELVHLLENAGVLTKADIFTLDAKLKSLQKKGQYTDLNHKDQRENRADLLARLLEDRSLNRKTPAGRVLQKVLDFIDSIVALVKPTVRSMARGMETGSIYSKKASAGKDKFGAVGAMVTKKNPDIQYSATSPNIDLQQRKNDAVKRIFHHKPTMREEIKGLMDQAKSKESRELAQDRFLTKTLDRLHFIQKRLGDKAYRMHRVLTGISTATFSQFLEHGPVTIKDNVMVVKDRKKGALPFMQSLGPDLENLLYWVTAKRAKELRGQKNEDGSLRENWITEEEQEDILNALGTHAENGKTWQFLNKKFQTINKNMLDVAQQAGLIDPESRKVWESDYYIPFYRILENSLTKEEFLSGPKGAKKHISAQIRRLRGGKEKIGVPLENVLHNWMHLLDASARNIARESAFEAGTEIGIIREVPKSELINILGAQTVKKFAVTKEGNQRATRIYETKEEAEEFINSFDDDGFDNLNYGKADQYRIEPRKETVIKFGNMKDLGILSFQKNGKPVYFETEDNDLYEAMAETDKKHMDFFLLKLMGKAKRGLSYAATFSHGFKARNMIRDTVHTAIVKKSFIPVVDTARGFFKAMIEDPDYIEFMSSGFGFGSSYVNSDDPQVGAKFIKKIVKAEGKGALGRILSTPEKMLSVWEKIGTAGENAARLGLYTRLKKDGYSTLNAGFAARDVMDFSMRGSSGSVEFLTRTVPFLNARFQALYKLGRATKADPKAVLGKGLLLTGASLLLWSAFKDDDRYKELEDWDKWTYSHFWVGDKHYRIPKPFEMGALFCSLPETIANIQNETEEGKAVWDWFKFTGTSIFKVDMPQLFKPLWEERSNYNSFTGRKIVPEYMKNLDASERAYPWTGSTVKMIGEKAGISPLKLEHYIRGYMASIGMGVLTVTDILSRDLMGYPERPKEDIFRMVSGQLVSEDREPRNTKYSTKFYQMYDEMAKATATFNHYKKTGETEKASEWEEKNRELIKTKPTANKIRKQLVEINDEIKGVHRSKYLTAKEKAHQIDALLARKNKITKDGFEKIRAAKR